MVTFRNTLRYHMKNGTLVEWDKPIAKLKSRKSQYIADNRQGVHIELVY